MGKKVVIQRKGQTMKEGTIGKWLKKDGDFVKAGEPIYELEYDKATCEVEAPAEGTLRIYVEEGSTFPVGTLVGEILKDGEESSAKTLTAEKKETVQEPVKKAFGYGISASAKRLIRQNHLSVDDIVPVNGKRIMEEDVVAYMEKAKTKATPLAKKMAEANSISLEEVAAGRADKMRAADVTEYMNRREGADEEDRRVPLSAMRKAIAKNMEASYFHIPVVTYSMEVDFSECMKLRNELNEEYKKQNLKVSINDMVLKAVAVALRKNSEINVSLDGNDVVYHKGIHVGMAVSVPGGLVVPVVRNTDKISMADLSKETKRLIQKASDGELTGDDMSGGTFTVSNIGSKGVDMFTPIINGSQAAILGVGRVQEKPVVVNGAIEIRPMMVLSLTADHRLIDGSPAADFLGVIKRVMEKPILMFI